MENSCGVCFDDLTILDLEHPVLCPSQNCHFNLCKRCISHLVESSKSDYEMASDGNMHVKVKLQCPSCRGDFSSTIEDTLLVRNAIEIHQSFQQIPDTQLSSSDLRSKYTYTTSFIEEIKTRLAKHARTDESKYDTRSKDSCDNTILEPLFFPNTRIPIDHALFAGLESIMTLEEQLFVTQFMISGDCNQVALAAQILNGIGNVVRRGYRAHPTMTTTTTTTTTKSQVDPSSVSLSRKITPTEPEMRALEMSFTGTQAEHVKLWSKLEKHRRLHPLPHFMPLFVTMEADFDVYAKHRKVLKFQDDEWDGSIAHGFTCAINLDDSLDEEETESIELTHDEYGYESDERLIRNHDPPPQPFLDRTIGSSSPQHGKKHRVIIRKARFKAAAIGITSGMVVTHFNGDSFQGTAEELKQSLYKLYLAGKGNQTFTMVLNADPYTANALKLRASFFEE